MYDSITNQEAVNIRSNLTPRIHCLLLLARPLTDSIQSALTLKFNQLEFVIYFSIEGKGGKVSELSLRCMVFVSTPKDLPSYS